MLFRNIDQRAAHRGGVHGARRVVRIDHDEHARLRRDQAAKVVEVRQPVASGIRAVVPGLGPHLGQHGGIERVGRRGHEHLLALADQRIQREIDGFRRARRDQHAIRRNRHAAVAVIGGDRFARGRNPRRRQISVVPVPDRRYHRLHEMRGRLEPEGHRVADVEVADARATSLDRLGFRHDVADRIGKAVNAGGYRHRPGAFRGHRPILPRRSSRTVRHTRQTGV